MTDGVERRVAVVIEDDADIRHLLETVLNQAGFETILTGNGLDGIQAVRSYEPLVTTLDVSMPGMDGFETAKRIRAFSNTYLVMLTARDDEIDTLQGLEAGADDYLTKPFRPRELRARIDAMMRRPRAVGPNDEQPTAPVAQPAFPPAQPIAAPQQPNPPQSAPPAYGAPTQPAAMPAVPRTDAEPAAYPPNYDPAPAAAPAWTAAPKAPAHGSSSEPVADDDGYGAWVEHNALRLNAQTRIVQLQGQEIDLTRSEFDLLAALLDSGRRVRTKADLALLLRGESYVTAYYISETDKRAIEVHMANLRRKLGDSIASPRWIETVRGVGYRLTARED